MSTLTAKIIFVAGGYIAVLVTGILIGSRGAEWDANQAFDRGVTEGRKEAVRRLLEHNNQN